MLEAVDQGKSLLVIAPTSSGKSWAAESAALKVLREKDNGLIVFVQPTNALVTQTYAAVEQLVHEAGQRPGQEYMQRENLPVAAYTADIRPNFNEGAYRCLVTNPQCLENLLLSPSTGPSHMLTRLKLVVFDEIHTIGLGAGTDNSGSTAETLERLLTMIRCPIVCLTATMPDEDAFYKWLKHLKRAHQRGAAQGGDGGGQCGGGGAADPPSVLDDTSDQYKCHGLQALKALRAGLTALGPAKAWPPTLLVPSDAVAEAYNAVRTIWERANGEVYQARLDFQDGVDKIKSAILALNGLEARLYWDSVTAKAFDTAGIEWYGQCGQPQDIEKGIASLGLLPLLSQERLREGWLSLQKSSWQDMLFGGVSSAFSKDRLDPTAVNRLEKALRYAILLLTNPTTAQGAAMTYAGDVRRATLAALSQREGETRETVDDVMRKVTHSERSTNLHYYVATLQNKKDGHATYTEDCKVTTYPWYAPFISLSCNMKVSDFIASGSLAVN
jgi:hypothetical protein